MSESKVGSGFSLKDGMLFDGSEIKGEARMQRVFLVLAERQTGGKEKKKFFADNRKRCTLTSLDRIRSSSLNLLSSEYTPKSISLSLRTQGIFSRIKQD
ncbi:hypothetical protein G9409_02885 [Chlorobium sp. BLA1]|uniref:hypothetical protein n=1 Tax=Candidatus Chlorobium masyuteum TaxID=2716876 RepID=UPI00141E32D1|nr:hypothetical protein [Candidatus Chlorobium masyuteum]NHQ59419.1 hypothetical protein [Candidatus Chlorobium masyuteum]NHQ59541.1 hypothetical protein [Candidatus Chlorobium masyuteum]